MKYNIIIILVVVGLILDFIFHSQIIKNFGDIKYRLTFNAINYSIISIFMFIIIIIFNQKKDYDYLKNLFEKKYFEKFKLLMNDNSYNNMIRYLDNYIRSICYVHYSKLIPNIYIYSMLDLKALQNIEDYTKYILDNNIAGDFVECGVWRGGTGILIKNILQKYNNNDRKVFLLDSYEGMENLEKSNNLTEKDKLDEICSNILNDIEKYYGRKLIETDYDEVINNLKHFNCYDENVILLKGWFNEKFPFDNVQSISLLRLDCDYHYPTTMCLEKLYEKVTKGGVIILDEYYLDFMGEKKAVDEFRSKYGITSEIINVNNAVAYWIKE
jgi:hypothetical protein